MLSGIDPSKLDVYLTFERYTSAENTIGEPEKTWTTYGSAFGRRLWKPSGENYQAMQLVATDKLEFEIRYDSGIDQTMRFKQGGESTYFYILNIDQNPREGSSIITAERRDNQ